MLASGLIQTASQTSDSSTMARNFDAEAFRGAASYPEGGEEDENSKSSLSKTMQNVLSMVNDGLYRFKNRQKAE